MSKDKKKNHQTAKQNSQKAERNSGAFTLGDLWPKSPQGPPSVAKAPPKSGPGTGIPARQPQLAPIGSATQAGPKESPKVPNKDFATLLKTVNAIDSFNRVTAAQTAPAGSNQRRKDYQTQIENSQSRQQAHQATALDVIVGLDLGTGFTKVVWRDADADKAHILCFGTNPSVIEDYLLPSVVAFDGTFFAAGSDVEPFLKKSPKAERFSNFKMCLACVSGKSVECGLQRCPLAHWRPVLSQHVSEEEAVEIVTSLHIGKVIALSRGLIARHFAEQGINSPIRYTFNMAAPVDHVDDEDVVRAFDRVLKTGYFMADVFDEKGGPRGLDDLLDCYRTAREFALKRKVDCFVIPEVGAEVASMYMSRSARDGLYAFIDIGAGTVDVNFFRMYAGAEGRQISFYSAGVIKRGAAHLEAIASRQLAEQSSGWFRLLKEKKEGAATTTFPTSAEAKEFLKRAAEWISDEVESGVRHVSAEGFPKEMNHDEWKRLVLILGGGGANLTTYKDASRKGVSLLAPNLAAEPLPVPTDLSLKALPSSEFARFAVAYGLSFNLANLPVFNMPKDVDADKPLARKVAPENPTPDVG